MPFGGRKICRLVKQDIDVASIIGGSCTEMDMYLIPSIDANVNNKHASIDVYAGSLSTMVYGGSIADCWSKLKKYLKHGDKLKIPNDYVGYKLMQYMERDGFKPDMMKGTTVSDFFANISRRSFADRVRLSVVQ